jgi:hypothetical protein
VRILRGLAGRRLECGCLTGVYETYSGEVVEMIDWHADACRQSSHIEGGTIPGLSAVVVPEASPPPQPPRHH